MGQHQLPLQQINFLRIILLFLTFFFLGGCQEKLIENGDPNISIRPGVIYYKDSAFTGKFKQYNPVMEEFYIISYKNGVEDGEYTAQKKTGQLLEKRFFKDGQKHGIHRSWFPDGNNRLYSEFDNGKYINDKWDWYDTGHPSSYEKFDRDGKILVTKKWYRNGNIYMNVAFAKDGSSVGLPGSKICNPIKPLEKKAME